MRTSAAKKWMLACGGAVVAAVSCAVAAWSLFHDPLADIVPETRKPAESHTNDLQRNRLAKPDPPSQSYVGIAVCAECHSEVVQSYQQHPMWQSMTDAVGGAHIESQPHDAGFISPMRSGHEGLLRYYVERKDGIVLHHEARNDGEGNTVYDQAVPVRYTIGTGRRGQTYAIDRGGLLYLSPIAWNSSTERWESSLEYPHDNLRSERGKTPRFEFRITDACLHCHAGRVSANRDSPNRFDAPIFPEAGIGCERCHGPGHEHVAYHRSQPEPIGSDPIVVPTELPVRRREAVCDQCHALGGRRVLRYGRSEYDFRPGDDLSDIWTIFIRKQQEGPKNAIETISEVEQMRTSVCFERSNGQLGCVSCHDPHSAPPPAKRLDHYRSRCLRCHGQKEPPCAVLPEERRERSAGDSCIECHMPRVVGRSIPHTSRTDHRILLRPQEVDNRPLRDASFECFDGAEQRIPSLELRRARGVLMVQYAERQVDLVLTHQAIELLRPLLDAAEDDLPTLQWLGLAYCLEGRVDKAMEPWQRALELAPDHEPVLEYLAIVCHASDENQLGVEYLDRLLAINRWRHDLYGRHAHMLGKLGEFRRGVESAKRGLELNPSSTQLHGWLSEVYERMGEAELSRHHRRMLKLLSRQQ